MQLKLQSKLPLQRQPDSLELHLKLQFQLFLRLPDSLEVQLKLQLQLPLQRHLDSLEVQLKLSERIALEQLLNCCSLFFCGPIATTFVGVEDSIFVFDSILLISNLTTVESTYRERNMQKVQLALRGPIATTFVCNMGKRETLPRMAGLLIKASFQVFIECV